MSGFMKRLKAVTEGRTQPLGFTPAVSAKASPMLLVGELTPEQWEGIDPALLKQLDAVLISSADLPADEVLHRLKEENLPWGIWPREALIAEPAKLVKIGCEFAVFGQESRVELLGERKLSWVLEVSSALTDGLARAAGKLPVDAVLFADEVELPLKFGQLLNYQRLLDLIGKPSLLRLVGETSSGELAVLCEVGFRAIVVDLGRENLEKLESLRRVINSLRLPKKKEEETTALLPSVEVSEEFTGEEV